jgi:hypothetical protein
VDSIAYGQQLLARIEDWRRRLPSETGLAIAKEFEARVVGAPYLDTDTRDQLHGWIGTLTQEGAKAIADHMSLLLTLAAGVAYAGLVGGGANLGTCDLDGTRLRELDGQLVCSGVPMHVWSSSRDS